MSDPAASWRRYKTGAGPLHELTERIAKTIHEERHPGKPWEQAREIDTWLAVGSWQTAEAVVAILPLTADPAILDADHG